MISYILTFSKGKLENIAQRCIETSIKRGIETKSQDIINRRKFGIKMHRDRLKIQ